MPSISLNNGHSCRIEKLVIRRGDADCSGSLCLLPDEIVVIQRQYNLPVLIALEASLLILGEEPCCGMPQNLFASCHVTPPLP